MKTTIIILSIILVLFIVYSRLLAYPNNALYYKNILGTTPKYATPALPVNTALVSPVIIPDTGASVGISSFYRHANGLPVNTTVVVAPNYTNSSLPTPVNNAGVKPASDYSKDTFITDVPPGGWKKVPLKP